MSGILISVRMTSYYLCGKALRASKPSATSMRLMSGSAARDEVMIPRMIAKSSTTSAFFKALSLKLQTSYFTMQQSIFHSDTRLDHKDFQSLQVANGFFG